MRKNFKKKTDSPFGGSVIFFISFSHQLDIPFFCSISVKIAFSITTQIPLTHYFPLAKGKKIKHIRMNKDSFSTTEHAMANLFAKFLRLAAAPCAYWSPLSTFTHNVCNVMRGRSLLLRHSVKHYKTLRMKYCFIILFFFNPSAKCYFNSFRTSSTIY